MNPNFLSTYGTWNIDRFVQCHQGIDSSLILINVVDAMNGKSGGEEIGSLIVLIWQAMLAVLANPHGHRLSWNCLAFITPEPCSLVLAETIMSGIRPLCSSSYKIRAASILFGQHNRLSIFRDFEWQFSLADYRNDCPFAWYACNGIVEASSCLVSSEIPLD